MYTSFPRSLVPGTTTVRRALPSVEVIDPRLAWGTRHAPSHVVSATHPDEWCAWCGVTRRALLALGEEIARAAPLDQRVAEAQATEDEHDFAVRDATC